MYFLHIVLPSSQRNIKNLVFYIVIRNRLNSKRSKKFKELRFMIVTYKRSELT